MEETDIKRKIKNTAFMYEAIEDYPRAIDAHLLSWEWGNECSRIRLESFAHDYPQTLFNSVLKYVEEGFNRCKRVLGYCYENGFGTAIDMEKAVRCYAESLEYCKDPKLAAFIGACYYKGFYGLERDEHKVFALFQHASVKPKFAWLLGICYYKGIGCETDYQKAFELLKKTAEKSRSASLACFILGKCYFYGHGTEVDYEKAYSCFKRALGYSDLRLQLFRFHEQALNYLTKCHRYLQNIA